MSESTGASNPVERVVEKVKGTAKEAAGTIMGNEELRSEGEGQEQAAMREEGTRRQAGGREDLTPTLPGDPVSPADLR